MHKAPISSRFAAILLDSIFINIICGFIYGITESFVVYYLLNFFGTFLYYGICEGSSMSATLGKKICGIVVLDKDGQKLTSGQGFLRSVCRVVSGFTLGVGFLMALFDPEAKALHDKLAKTFVAKTSAAQQSAFIPQAPVQTSDNINSVPQIIGITGQFAGKAYNLPSQGAMFGRDAASCEFVFLESTQGISRNHCKIAFNPQTNMFVLYDLGSSYGTFLSNGTKVLQGQPVALRYGEEFYLASRANLFRVR